MRKAFFYGDSNTYGYDPAGYWGGRYPRSQRWTTIVAEGLAGKWEIAADGMPGRVIPAQGRALSYLADRLRAELPVDLFAVMLGTNDILGTLKPDAEKTTRDMEALIAGMMARANVSEAELRTRREIRTDSGETLSWDWLCDVRSHPLRWTVPTRILYGERDFLTPFETMARFAARIGAPLTVMPGGEHWFHTPEQMAFLDAWIGEAFPRVAGR